MELKTSYPHPGVEPAPRAAKVRSVDIHAHWFPAEWLKVQKGFKPPVPPAYVDHPKYLYRGRDLAQYVHIDELFQAYLNACLILITPNERGGLGAPLNPGNPYPMTNQTGFGTLGEPNLPATT